MGGESREYELRVTGELEDGTPSEATTSMTVVDGAEADADSWPVALEYLEGLPSGTDDGA